MMVVSNGILPVLELPIVALIVSLTGSVVGLFAWIRKNERDEYARERQLSHALDNFAAVKTSVNQLEDKVDEGFQQVTLELSQMKTLLSIAMVPSDQTTNSKIGRRRVNG